MFPHPTDPDLRLRYALDRMRRNDGAPAPERPHRPRLRDRLFRSHR
jgi:hypothetical protein